LDFDVPKDIKASWCFIFLPHSSPWNLQSEATDLNQFPLRNFQRHPCPAYRWPRGLQALKEQVLRQAPLFREWETRRKQRMILKGRNKDKQVSAEEGNGIL
jgi:hypothetical protein